jgi:uncharacterized metal-binding protein
MTSDQNEEHEEENLESLKEEIQRLRTELNETKSDHRTKVQEIRILLSTLELPEIAAKYIVHLEKEHALLREQVETAVSALETVQDLYVAAKPCSAHLPIWSIAKRSLAQMRRKRLPPG